MPKRSVMSCTTPLGPGCVPDLRRHLFCTRSTKTPAVAMRSVPGAVLEMAAQVGGLRRVFSLSGLGEQPLADGVLYRATELFQQGLRINFPLDEPLGIAVALDSLGRTALASVAETVPRHCSVSAGQGSAHATTAGQLTMSPDPRLCTNLP